MERRSVRKIEKTKRRIGIKDLRERISTLGRYLRKTKDFNAISG